MRILLISPNTEMLPDPVFPLGLAYLIAALKESHHEQQVLDLCFVEDYAEAITRAVTEFNPQAVGISLRNVDNVAYPNTHSYLAFYRQIVVHLRRLSAAPIILGGSGFSIMPRALLEHLEADYGICGEGEESLVRLLDGLEKGLAPGEDRQTVQETLDLMTGVSPTAVIAMVGIRLFPGTSLARTAAPEDLIRGGATLLQPTFFLAAAVRPFILERLHEHAARNPHWILPV